MAGKRRAPVNKAAKPGKSRTADQNSKSTQAAEKQAIQVLDSGSRPPGDPIPLEQEIKALLTKHEVSFDEGCASFDALDFCLHSEQRGDFYFDAKEKRQEIQAANWPDIGVPQEHLFILDDLAARKLLKFAPDSGLVVRDNLRGLYFFFDVVRLFLMPRVRVNRRIEWSSPAIKGKWIIDLRNGEQCASLMEVFEKIAAYHDAQEEIFHKVLACYGDYVGEVIEEGGITRRPEHWIKDREETR